MSYINQLKIFLWKNWKILKTKCPAFIYGIEVLLSVVIIFTLGSSEAGDLSSWNDPPNKFENINYDNLKTGNSLIFPFSFPTVKDKQQLENEYNDKYDDHHYTEYIYDEAEDYYSMIIHNGEEETVYVLGNDEDDNDDDYYHEYHEYHEDVSDEWKKEDFNLYMDDYSMSWPTGYGRIAFILPENQVEFNGDKFIDLVMNYPLIEANKNVDFIKLNNEKELFSHMSNRTLTDDSDIVAAVVFHQNFYNYTIRVNSATVPDPKSELYITPSKANIIKSECFNNFDLSDDCLTDASLYLTSLVPLQLAVDNAIITIKSNETSTLNSKYFIRKFQEFGGPEYFFLNLDEEDKKPIFSGFIPLVPFIFIGQLFHLSNRILEEKESKIKEGLVAIGAHRSLFWFSWEIMYFPISICVVLLILILNPSGIFQDINIILYAIHALLYCISIYQLTVILTFFVKNSNNCGIILILLSILTVVFNSVLSILRENGYEIYEKIFSIIYSPTNYSMAHGAFMSNKIKVKGQFYRISDYDLQYVSFNNMFKTEYGKYLAYLVVDIILYLAIIFILDFIEGTHHSAGGKVMEDNKTPYINDIQKDPTGGELSVQVQNITKYFKYRNLFGRKIDRGHEGSGKQFAANNHISFNVYKNEIFAILGHNGAGKSTLIQNMVGLQKPDGGDTYYDGLPISKNKKKININLGLCLQDNILFNEFTPGEHYRIFATIKGIQESSDEDINQWLRDIDLYEKKNFCVKELSGGQKRKLCIGLALIGNPKYVFLDEPTTGLDPLSRRKIWNLLQKKKKDRVIFICTHYMDEADIIADRKLILNKGVIRCMGSSVYLKSHFGMKYSLEIESDGQQIQTIESIVKRFVPEAEFYDNKTQVENSKDSSSKMKMDKSTEDRSEERPMNNCYVWKLPIQSSSSFAELFGCLEKEKEEGRIYGYSISTPMLEELFVNLERETDVEENAKAVELPHINSVVRPGTWSMALRFSRYRLKMYFHNYIYILMAIILPFIISFAVFFSFNKDIQKRFHDALNDVESPIELNPNLYQGYLWNYQYEDDSSLNKRISNQTIENSFPAGTLQGSSLSYYQKEDMVEKFDLIDHEPYYVSSFAGAVNENNAFVYNIYFNHTLTHAVPCTINGISNSILNSLNVNETIHTSSKPFHSINMVIDNIYGIRFYVILIFLACIGFSISFYGTNVVHEKVNGLFKQLQLNGVSNKSYWISVFLTDYLTFIITILAILISAVIVRFIPLQYITLLILSFVVFSITGIACIFLQYCLSYLFSRENKTYLALSLVNILASTIILLYFYINSYDADMLVIPDYKYMIIVSECVVGIFLPTFNITRLMKNIINLGMKRRYFNNPLSLSNIFSSDNYIIIELVISLISIALYGFIFYILDRKYNHPNDKLSYQMKEEVNEAFMKEIKEGDDDVKKEYERVIADKETNQLPIRMERLTMEYHRLKFKTGIEMHEALRRKNAKYGEFHLSTLGSVRVVSDAYHNVSIGIDKCECFGLLGPNGSGKTSVLNTAAFSYQPNLGTLYYDGQDMLHRKTNAYPIGYCPQEDTLWNELTLYEHIEMFLYLQGYSRSESKQLALEFIDYCRLTSHKNKLPSQLSGGTRRKLNILIALCCNSNKILLDEPTAGMDPSTRRYVWDMFKATIQNRQSSSLMSTHSMEEAELLCNRIGILVNGKLHCIGSPQHLRMKFGNTYILDVLTNDIERFHQELVINNDLFNGDHYVRKDKSLDRVEYEVTDYNGSHLGQVFKIMEEKRSQGLFNDYSYSKASLEQVFIHFANLKEIANEDNNETNTKKDVTLDISAEGNEKQTNK